MPVTNEEAHAKHCFVAMPSGTPGETRENLLAWFRHVYEPAIVAAEYTAELAMVTAAPSGITDEIFSHLVYDRLALFDLSGVEPGGPPNPNVMYELGIRHAFGLPAIIFMEDPKQLPFDVSSQRAIIEPRALRSMDTIRTALSGFIAAAEKGTFYKPLEHIRRAERFAVEAAGKTQFSQDVVAELSDLRGAVQGVSSLVRDVAIRVENWKSPLWDSVPIVNDPDLLSRLSSATSRRLGTKIMDFARTELKGRTDLNPEVDPSKNER